MTDTDTLTAALDTLTKLDAAIDDGIVHAGNALEVLELEKDGKCRKGAIERLLPLLESADDGETSEADPLLTAQLSAAEERITDLTAELAAVSSQLIASQAKVTSLLDELAAASLADPSWTDAGDFSLGGDHLVLAPFKALYAWTQAPTGTRGWFADVTAPETNTAWLLAHRFSGPGRSDILVDGTVRVKCDALQQARAVAHGVAKFAKQDEIEGVSVEIHAKGDILTMALDSARETGLGIAGDVRVFRPKAGITLSVQTDDGAVVGVKLAKD